MRTAKPCGPGTRCWCQAAGGEIVSYRRRSAIRPAATVTRRIRRRGEHGISRKAIAQGMPECSDCTCMLVCAFTCASCTRDRGCSAHPAFPAPSAFEGKGSSKTRAQCAARTRNCIRRHCERSEAIHSFFVPRGGLLRFARNDVDGSQPPTYAGYDAPQGKRKILHSGSANRVSSTSVTPM